MHRIGVLMSPDYSVMSFSPIAVFEVANVVTGKPIYDVRLLSETGGLISASIGMT